MNVRDLLLLAVWLCAASVVPAWAAASQVPEGLPAFVNRAVGELISSPLQVPQFESAQIETIEGLGAVGGMSRYLCWLKNDQGRIGYVAIAATSDRFAIMALSATTAPPDYFLKHLTVSRLPARSLDLSRAKDMSFIENLPLVASTETMLGAESIQISELASSLVSFFQYLQDSEDIFFFGHSYGTKDPQYRPPIAPMPKPRDPNWQSVEEECREAIKGVVISQKQTSEERAAAMVRQRELARPIVRRRLLNPIDAYDRLETIQVEWNLIGRPARIDISPNMKGALFFQLDYLSGSTASLKQDLSLFLRTRGRVAQIEIVPFVQPQAKKLPPILIGPDGIAGVVVGSVHIDREPFVWVFLPKTGAPLVRTVAEWRRARRLKQGLPPEPNYVETEEFKEKMKVLKETEERTRKVYAEKGLPDPLPQKSIEERIRDSIKRYEAFENESKITEDKGSTFEQCVQNGIHLVRCSNLASWNMLQIHEVGLADNWGVSDSSPDTDQNASEK